MHHPPGSRYMMEWMPAFPSARFYLVWLPTYWEATHDLLEQFAAIDDPPLLSR